MTDLVGCTECGNHYDSEEHPFCPRCGGMGRTEAPHGPALALASRADPRRRRIRSAGIMLIVLGGLLAALAIGAATQVPKFTTDPPPELTSMPGGDIGVVVLAGDAPIQGASVHVMDLAGQEVANGTTDASGAATFESLPEAGVVMHVQHNGTDWQRQVFTYRDLHTGDARQQVAIDVTEDQPESATWIGLSQIRTAMFAVLAVIGAAAGASIIAGAQAVRVRGRGMAIAGAAAGMLPWLLLSALSPLMLIVPAVYVYAIVTFAKGRPAFA